MINNDFYIILNKQTYLILTLMLKWIQAIILSNLEIYFGVGVKVGVGVWVGSRAGVRV